MGSAGQTFFGGSNSDQTSNSRSGNYAYPGLAQTLGSSVSFLPNGGNFMGSLLGIPGYGSSTTPASGGTTPTPSPTPTPTPGGNPFTSGGGTSGYTGPSLASIQAMQHDGIPGNYRAAMGQYQLAQSAGNGMGGAGGDGGTRNKPGTGPSTTPSPTPSPTPTPTPGGTPSGTTPQQNALQTFSDSAGMKFLEDNGNRMINNNAAAKGMAQSGATAKGIEDYGQQLHSTYLNQYMNDVLNFSKLGEMSAGTLAAAGANSQSSGTGSSNSKPGILPGMQQAAASMAAAG